MEGSPTPANGLVIDGRYLLEKCLGKGGMGSVYQAKHIDLQKDFALKLISSLDRRPAESLLRFRKEAMALGRLDHPNIVRVTDFGVDFAQGNLPYLVMEFLPGETLDNLIRKGPLPWEQARPILESIAAAIDYAHENGVIHGDLKPSNILITSPAEGPPIPRILDFGLAQILEYNFLQAESGPGQSPEEPAGICLPRELTGRYFADDFPEEQTPAQVTDTITVSVPGDPEPATDRLTWNGTFLGTPQYAPPEVIHRKSRPASDMYAFGLIAFEMLTGQRPFSGDAAQLIRQHLCTRPPAPSTFCREIPAAVDALISGTLEKDPALRPPLAVPIVALMDQAFAREKEKQRKKRQLPRQMTAALLLSLLVLFGTRMLDGESHVRWLEDQFYDRTGQFRRSLPMDPRIMLTLIPEQFWTQTGNLDMERFTGMIEQILQAGAGGVVIDLLLPERCNRSPAFARLLLRHGSRIRLSFLFLDDGTIRGKESVQGLLRSALSGKALSSLFCYINVEEEHGIIRRYRTSITDDQGQRYVSLGLGGSQLLMTDQESRQATLPLFYRIHPSINWQDRLLPWESLESLLKNDPGRLRNCLVFLGGKSDYQEDVVRIPHNIDLPEIVPGVVVHANVAHGILSGQQIIRMDSWLFYAGLSIGFFLVTFGILRSVHRLRSLAIPAFTLLSYIISAVWGFLWWDVQMVLVAPMSLAIGSCLILLLFRK